MDYHLFSRAMAGSVDFTPGQIDKITGFLSGQGATIPEPPAGSKEANDVKKMGTGIKCPRCGELNEPSRFTCSKCYASLKAVQSKVQTASSGKPQAGLSLRTLPQTVRDLSLYSLLVYVIAAGSLATTLLIPSGDDDRIKAAAHVAAMIVAALGLVATIRAGGFDLSIAGVAALSGMLAAFSGKHHVVMGVVVALATGLIIGWANGILVTRIKFHSGLLTLCMGVGLSGLVLSFGKNDPAFSATAAFALSYSIGLPLIMIAIVAAAVLIDQWLKNTDFSLTLPESDGIYRGTRLSAEQAYLLSGILASVAGLFLIGVGVAPSETTQSGWHLFPIAATIAGGAVLREHRARVSHAILGGLILGALTWYVGNIGVTTMQLLMVAVAIIGLLALDRSKDAKLTEVRESMRHNPRAAFMNTGGGLAVLAISYLTVYDAATRIPPESAVVVNHFGTVSVRRGRDSDFEKLSASHANRVLVRTQGALRTGPQSAAMVKLSNGSVIKVTSSTELEFGEICQLSGQTLVTRMRMNFGRLYTKVQEVAGGEQSFEVQTPTAVAAVRGTTWSIASSGGNDYVSVNEGIVDVKAAGVPKRVSKGEATRVVAGASPAEPAPMSWEESSAWIQEDQDLRNPTGARLGEQMQQNKFLADDFDESTLNPALWYLRGDAGITVKPINGQLQVSSPAATARASYGAISLPFSLSSAPVVEGSVLAMTRGTGRTVFRLTDRRGSNVGVTLSFDADEGYTLRSSDQTHALPPMQAFRNENVSMHALSLRYDASTGMTSATVDGMLLGSVPASFQNKEAHFELLNEGGITGKPIDSRFDNFRTNVKLPDSDMVTEIIGIGTRGGSPTPTGLLALAPLGEKSNLKNVKVNYPKRGASDLKTRLLVQSTFGEAELKYDNTAKAFLLEEPGVTPAGGDFVFKFLTSAKRDIPIQTVKFEEPREIPRMQVEATKSANGQLLVSWTPVEKGDAYWVDVFNAEKNTIMSSSVLLGADTQQWAVLPAELTQGRHYYVRVVAHRFHQRASLPNRETWQSELRPLAKWMTPTSGLFAAIKTPQGHDEFVVQVGTPQIW